MFKKISIGMCYFLVLLFFFDEIKSLSPKSSIKQLPVAPDSVSDSPDKDLESSHSKSFEIFLIILEIVTFPFYGLFYWQWCLSEYCDISTKKRAYIAIFKLFMVFILSVAIILDVIFWIVPSVGSMALRSAMIAMVVIFIVFSVLCSFFVMFIQARKIVNGVYDYSVDNLLNDINVYYRDACINLNSGMTPSSVPNFLKQICCDIDPYFRIPENVVENLIINEYCNELNQKFSSMLSHVEQSLAHLRGQKVTKLKLYKIVMTESNEKIRMQLTVHDYMSEFDNEFLPLVFQKICDFFSIILEKNIVKFNVYKENLKKLENNVKRWSDERKIEEDLPIALAIKEYKFLERYVLDMGDDYRERTDLRTYMSLQLERIKDDLILLIDKNPLRQKEMTMLFDRYEKATLKRILNRRMSDIESQLMNTLESLFKEVDEVKKRLEQVGKDIQLLQFA